MLNPNEKESLSILIVDDESSNIQLLGNLLKEEGYQIEFAMNGEQALEWAQLKKFDAILLDVMMPGMDGFTVCERLKKDTNNRDVPVIFLTAKTDPESTLKGFNVGAIDYITKPFQKSELLARVQTHLELNLNRARLQAAYQTLEHQNRELKEAGERLLQKNSEQKELLHVLCHDLMNPIGLVQSWLEIVEEQPDLFSQAKNEMTQATRNAQNIIGLIRKIQGLEEGKIQLDLTSVDLRDAITESLMLLNHQFTKKEIKPVIIMSEKLHAQAERASLVNSVFNNLLTNAVKYSFPGSQVMIEAQRLEQQAVLSVKDFGMGIPKHLLQDIFEPHKHTTRHGTNGELGTGFGMPLVKKFVTAYGGTIEISSKDQSEYPDDHGTKIKLFLKIG